MRATEAAIEGRNEFPSRGVLVNSGAGPTFQLVDIEHERYLALIEPDTAFWSLVDKCDAGDVFSDGKLMAAHRAKASAFASELDLLRHGLKPSAVYFNPTERCNLNCSYCYIPEGMRRSGAHMSKKQLLDALARLKLYFVENMAQGELPQVVFHGAEPLLNRDALFSGIELFSNDFRFGVQTNGTLLDREAVEFLRDHNVSIGISLDAATAQVADRTRKTWEGASVFDRVVSSLDLLRERLKGYGNWSVISTLTSQNMEHLCGLVDLFHDQEVPTCLINVVRCTLPSAREIRPNDVLAAQALTAALDRTYEHYKKTGRKLIVGNFANILLAIMAPTARRLMCDISPCGAGRCFFALAPNGDLFPCSEFVGVPEFKGGNLFEGSIKGALESSPFTQITQRRVEDVEPCRRCAIRHFCGAPCPAEAYTMNPSPAKTVNRVGAFCEFYEQQVRYAFRLIADNKQDAFLWDGWQDGMETVFCI